MPSDTGNDPNAVGGTKGRQPLTGSGKSRTAPTAPSASAPVYGSDAHWNRFDSRLREIEASLVSGQPVVWPDLETALIYRSYKRPENSIRRSVVMPGLLFGEDEEVPAVFGELDTSSESASAHAMWRLSQDILSLANHAEREGDLPLWSEAEGYSDRFKKIMPSALTNRDTGVQDMDDLDREVRSAIRRHRVTFTTRLLPRGDNVLWESDFRQGHTKLWVGTRDAAVEWAKEDHCHRRLYGFNASRAGDAPVLKVVRMVLTGHAAADPDESGNKLTSIGVVGNDAGQVALRIPVAFSVAHLQRVQE